MMFHNLKSLILKVCKMKKQLPLVVILGATGTGKTKLSLELSEKFRGEIIGADAMQVYQDLDILTAKATQEERSSVPHHLIDVIHPTEQFTVVDYRNRVLPTIDEIFKQEKVPIIVGGTNYYIESILWKILVDNDQYCVERSELFNRLKELSSEDLHKQLKEVDFERAMQLHPNNKRKILRSLEIYYSKGRQHSQILQHQRESKGGSSLGGALRYRNVVIFWLQSEQAILDERLNLRVDAMIKDGLVAELELFYGKYMKTNEVDYTKGIYQSIGLREFHKYLMEDCNDDERNILLQNALDGLKLVTRRYARRQRRWIINRLLSVSDREVIMVPPVYGLDVTDVTQWDQNVRTVAFNIMESFLNGVSCAHEPLSRVKTSASPVSQAKTFTCEVCQRIFIGDLQWQAHQKSHGHRKMLAAHKENADLTIITKS